MVTSFFNLTTFPYNNFVSEILPQAKATGRRLRPSLVPRLHLIEKLQKGLAKKLAPVSTPVGLGKTTFSSGWIQQLTRPSAWLPVATLAVFMILFIITYSWLGVTRHQRFNSTGFDLAINEQIVWNTLNGRFFASSLEVDNSFADHFRPFLLAVLPIYALWQRAETLIILQVVVLASAAVPLYLLARHKLENDWLPLVLVIVYLLYAPVGFIARFDFHIEVFAIPAFIAAIYAMEKGRWGWASLWLIIPLLSKENMGLIVAGVAIYALLKHRRIGWGVSWLFIGLISFWGTSFWLIPTVRGEAMDAIDRYAWLGTTPAEMVNTLILSPEIVWQQVTRYENLRYLVQISLPVGFLFLLTIPELLLLGPGLALNLLSQHFCQPTIYCHYTVPVTPFIFVAAVYGLYRLKKILKNDIWLKIAAGLLILCAVISFVRDNPFAEAELLPSALAQMGNADIVPMALAVVPDEATVVTTNDYAPHLARRQGLYIIGIPAQREAPKDPDIVFLNLYDQQYIVCDQIRDYVAGLDLDNYGVIFRTGGLIVLQKGGGSPELFHDFVNNWNNCAG